MKQHNSKVKLTQILGPIYTKDIDKINRENEINCNVCASFMETKPRCIQPNKDETKVGLSSANVAKCSLLGLMEHISHQEVGGELHKLI